MEFQVSRYDCAPKDKQQTNNKKHIDELKVVQWNIERGIEYEKILDHLKQLDADILILQELDVNCKRSGFRNVPRQLAQDLQLNGVFVPEFEELDCHTRSPLNAVGSELSRKASDVLAGAAASSVSSSSSVSSQQQGKKTTSKRVPRHQLDKVAFHGNAIYTKFEIADHDVVAHEDGIDWEVEGIRLQEPRLGKRVSLAMKIKLPTTTNSSAAADNEDEDQTAIGNIKNRFLWCYSVHTEVFAGAATRVRTYADVLEHAYLVTGTRGAGAPPPNPASACGVIIGGDLNTVVAGIVRLSKHIGNDRQKLTMPFWMSEAQTFDYLAFAENKSPFGRMLSSFAMGMEDKVLSLFDKNMLGLCDPFDLNNDFTLDHPSYRALGRSFVAYKLDWLIASSKETAVGFKKRATSLLLLPKKQLVFNHDFKSSDHKGLCCVYEVRNSMEKGLQTRDAAVAVAEREWHNDERRNDVPTQFMAYFVILTSWVLFLIFGVKKYLLAS